jgi:hypothetical protein
MSDRQLPHIRNERGYESGEGSEERGGEAIRIM